MAEEFRGHWHLVRRQRWRAHASHFSFVFFFTEDGQLPSHGSKQRLVRVKADPSSPAQQAPLLPQQCPPKLPQHTGQPSWAFMAPQGTSSSSSNNSDNNSPPPSITGVPSTVSLSSFSPGDELSANSSPEYYLQHQGAGSKRMGGLLLAGFASLHRSL